MKKLLIFGLAVGILPLFTSAQETKESKDSTTVEVGGVKVIFLNNDKKDSTKTGNEEDEVTYWGGLDFGMSMLGNSGMKSIGNLSPESEDWQNVPGKSLYWGLNLIEIKTPILKNRLYGSTGLGLSYSSYTFKRNITLFENSDTTQAVLVNDFKFTKNKLRISHVQVPLLLTYQSPGSLYVTAGVVGQVRLGSRLKQKYNEGNEAKKSKIVSDFNLNDFGAYAHLRIGFEHFTLFTNYNMTSLFESGKGPDLVPITFGISIL